jgi:prepilin-type N-terminal cleavage/methylation domain-containing protein
MHVRKSRRGFTLTEMMVVVAILGLLAVVGISSMARQNDARAVRGAAAELQDIMQQLRARAVTTNRAVVLTVVAGGNGSPSNLSWTESTSNLCAGATAALTPAGTLVMDAVNPNSATRNTAIMRVRPSATGSLRICFQPSGRVVDPATGRPFASLSAGALGGRAYVELAPLDCDSGAVCTALPYVMTLAIGFNGLSEVMNPEFRLP